MPVNKSAGSESFGSPSLQPPPLKQSAPQVEQKAKAAPEPQLKKVPFWEREVPFLSKSNRSRFSPKELIQFYRGIGAMLKAQLTTADALYFYSKGLPNKKFAERIQGIHEDLTQGVSIRESFRRADCFNDMTIGLINSGSDAGRLDKAFAALASRLSTDIEFKKKLKKVTLIPSIVIPILLVVFAVAQIKVVPQVEEMLAQVRVEPDPVSKIAFNFSHLVQSYWPLFFGTLTVIVLILKFSEASRNFVLNMMMSRWRLLRKLIMSLRQMTLLSTISLLHSNGINLVRALRVAATTLKGTSLHKEVLEAADRYEQTGIPVSTAFSKYTSVDEQVCHMLAIGERSASIDDNLDLLALMYEEEAENQMESLTQIVNVLVLFVAVSLIGAVFISAFLPIFLMGPKLMQNAF